MPSKFKDILSNLNLWQGIMYACLALIILLSAAKLWLITQQFENSMDETTYQVVFLDNSESYFGQMQNIGFKYFKLSDVYYIKKSNAESESQPDSQYKIIKLGDEELYQPQAEMFINKNHIIHWENLQADSQVLEYILNQK